MNIPRPWQCKAADFKGLWEVSVPSCHCVWLGFKTLQVWSSLINSPSGLRSPCGGGNEMWWEVNSHLRAAMALPSSHSWMPSKVSQCFTGALRATQKPCKQGTIGITGTARLCASLTSQTTFPYPHFPMGRLRHREIFASSTSSQIPRNNNNNFFLKAIFKLSAICADFQCNFPI